MSKCSVAGLAFLLIGGAMAGAAAQSAGQTETTTEPKVIQLPAWSRDCSYPVEAMRNNIAACCAVKVDVAADGKVLGVKAACSDPAFVLPTQRCAAAVRYAPATRGGKPVRGTLAFEQKWLAQSMPPEEVDRLCQPAKDLLSMRAGVTQSG
jgi:hypothetical protein